MTRFIVALGLIVAMLSLSVVAMPRPADASSHREAPYITGDPYADATDVYAFVSPDVPDTVTFVANYVPLQLAASGPNFYRFGDDVLYEINIDNDGDALDDIVFQFRFRSVVNNGNTFLYNTGPVTSLDDPDLNQEQFYSVSVLNAQQARTANRRGAMIADNLQVAPYDVGPISFPDYSTVANQAIYELGDGLKVFAGPRDDPFYADLGGIFDLLSGITGEDYLADLNVHSIVLQVPIAWLTANGETPTGADDPNAIIGVRTTSYRQSSTVLRPFLGNPNQSNGPANTTGPWVQLSRLDMPLVNEVVIPLVDKNRWNNSKPINDGQFLSYVQNPELAGLLTAVLGVSVPPNPRDDIVTIFLTGIPGLNQPAGVTPSSQLRLNMAIPPSAVPNRLGVLGGDLAGFPNGRRLADDVVDIELQALAGCTPFTPAFNIEPNCSLGDGVDTNDKPFLATFPYLAEPTSYDETD